MQGLRQPFVGPFLRIAHDPREAEPGARIVVGFAGDAGERKVLAARRRAHLQHLGADERLLVDPSNELDAGDRDPELPGAR